MSDPRQIVCPENPWGMSTKPIWPSQVEGPDKAEVVCYTDGKADLGLAAKVCAALNNAESLGESKGPTFGVDWTPDRALEEAGAACVARLNRAEALLADIAASPMIVDEWSTDGAIYVEMSRRVRARVQDYRQKQKAE